MTLMKYLTDCFFYMWKVLVDWDWPSSRCFLDRKGTLTVQCPTPD